MRPRCTPTRSRTPDTRGGLLSKVSCLHDRIWVNIFDYCCKSEGRIFVTLDLDFADIRTYPPDEHPRIIVLRPARQDKLHVLDVFRRTLKAVGHEPLEGRLWIVEEKRIRIR